MTIPTIDLDAIKQQLFDDPAIRSRIARDYGLPTSLDAAALEHELLHAFQQTPVAAPLTEQRSNAELFRAAVRTLGSNSRTWATFLQSEAHLRSLLLDYDPRLTARAVVRGMFPADELKGCLPGQSSSADARAILQWAQLLAEVEDYYGYIQDIAKVFQQLHQLHHRSALSDAHLLICIVGYVAYPPPTWSGRRLLSERNKALTPAQRKLPGMGYALASEFLRNLGWNGFKPDRQIIRLFERWFPDRSFVESDVRRLQALIGPNTQDLKTYLTYSLLGIATAPPDVPLSHVDNLIGLLAVYVEKKGSETSQNYLMRRSF